MTPELRLLTMARAMLGTSFRWGETDCVATLVRLWDAYAGTDVLSSTWVGRWTSRTQAHRAMRTYPITVELARIAEQIPPPFVTVGDALLFPPWSVHVVLGAHAVSADPDKGVFLFETRALIGAPDVTAWRLRCPPR